MCILLVVLSYFVYYTESYPVPIPELSIDPTLFTTPIYTTELSAAAPASLASKTGMFAHMPSECGHPNYTTAFLQNWISDAQANNVMPEGLVEVNMPENERAGSDPGSRRGKVLYKLAILPDVKTMVSFFQGWSAQGPAYVMGSAVKYKTETLHLRVNGPVLVPEMLAEKAKDGQEFLKQNGISKKYVNIDNREVMFGDLKALRQYACPNGPVDLYETDPDMNAPIHWWDNMIVACSPYIIVTSASPIFKERMLAIVAAAKKKTSPYEVVGANLVAAIGNFRYLHPGDPVNLKGTWSQVEPDPADADWGKTQDRRYFIFNLRADCRSGNMENWKAMKPCSRVGI